MGKGSGAVVGDGDESRLTDAGKVKLGSDGLGYDECHHQKRDHLHHNEIFIVLGM